METPARPRWAARVILHVRDYLRVGSDCDFVVEKKRCVENPSVHADRERQRDREEQRDRS